jgi:hypothetical protein
MAYLVRSETAGFEELCVKHFYRNCVLLAGLD